MNRCHKQQGHTQGVSVSPTTATSSQKHKEESKHETIPRTAHTLQEYSTVPLQYRQSTHLTPMPHNLVLVTVIAHYQNIARRGVFVQIEFSQ